MNCLDSSVVIDVLNDTGDAAERFDEYDDPFYAPTVVLSEVLEGLLAGDLSDTEAERRRSWLQPLELTYEAASEAARVQMELRRTGDPIPDADTFIAGVVRAHGGRIITRDQHFERVADLDVVVL